MSKAEKGFCLATSETPTSVKARIVEYDPEVTLDDAVIVVTSNTLAQFVGNWAALRVTDQPEAVHQARVALRRLRAALALFGRVIPARLSMNCAVKPGGSRPRSVRRANAMYFASRHSQVHWLTPTGRNKLMACSRRSKTGVLLLIVMSALSSKTLAQPALS